jgi:hypothetical protein
MVRRLRKMSCFRPQFFSSSPGPVTAGDLRVNVILYGKQADAYLLNSSKYITIAIWLFTERYVEATCACMFFTLCAEGKTIGAKFAPIIFMDEY